MIEQAKPWWLLEVETTESPQTQTQEKEPSPAKNQPLEDPTPPIGIEVEAEEVEEATKEQQKSNSFEQEEEPQETAKDCTHPHPQAAPLPSLDRPSPPVQTWSEEAAGLVEWFLATTELPTAPFQMDPWRQIAEPARYYEALRADIEVGPTGLRAQTGVLEKDLQRLFDIHTNPSTLPTPTYQSEDRRGGDAKNCDPGLAKHSTKPARWIPYRLQKEQHPLAVGMKFQTVSGQQVEVLEVFAEGVVVQVAGAANPYSWPRLDLDCSCLLPGSSPPKTEQQAAPEMVRELVKELDDRLCLQFGKEAVRSASGRAGIVSIGQDGRHRYCQPADKIASHLSGQTRLKPEEVAEKIPPLLRDQHSVCYGLSNPHPSIEMLCRIFHI